MRGFLRQVKVFSHTRLTTCLGVLAFALLCFGAPSALAENCNAPPGTSGIDQYCEAIPTPGGSGGGSHHKGPGGGNETQRLSPKTTRTLEHSGAAGATVLALTRTSPSGSGPAVKQAPATNRRHKSSKKHQAASTGQQAPTATPPVQDTTPAANTSFGVGNSVSGSLGAGFIAVLAGIGLMLGGLAWFGRRRGTPGEPAQSES
jgi:hypothetical protein